MCQKKSYCNREIDKCIQSDIVYINKAGFKTVLSCCGHGKYFTTIVIRRKDNTCFEFLTDTPLNNYNLKKDKRHNTYYKKDSEGYYFIPEAVLTMEEIKLLN